MGNWTPSKAGRQEFEWFCNQRKWQAICAMKDRDRARYWNRMFYLEQRLKW